jgi:pimeloyl-ACP methyl ester carboxylesterase
VNEGDLELGPGTVHYYDTGPADGLVVFWHHGTPNLGDPPEPLFRDGLRWVSFDRPGYGGSTANEGRDIASAAGIVEAIADVLGIDRFAVMGYSGGGSHALACAALLPERVLAVASMGGIAPYGVQGLDWFAGMADPGSLRAALQGRAAKEAHEATNDGEPAFIQADFDALAGPWGWLGRVAGKANEGGPGGLIADDLAYVAPWGCDPADVTAPVLLMHGEKDAIVPSAHSRWLAGRCPAAELRLTPDDGHVSILGSGGVAVDWLSRNAS